MLDVMAAAEKLWTCNLGRLPWSQALGIQEQLRAMRQDEAIADTLLLLEHPPTVTLGRRALPNEVPGGSERLASLGIAFAITDRGGRATCHEPGQLVGYPIMRIADVHRFVRDIELSIIAALAESGVNAGTREGLTGVWCEDRKIGSIGIHVQRGVTTHGFSINADNSLETFSHVTPCGLPDVEMTSVALEGGDRNTTRLRERVAAAFAKQAGLRPLPVSPDQLGIAAEPARSESPDQVAA